MISTIFNLIKWGLKALLGRVFWIGTLIFSLFKWLFSSFTMVFAVMRGYTIYNITMKILSIPIILGLAFMFLDYGFNSLKISFLENQSIGSYLTTLIESVPLLNDAIIVAGHSGFLTMLSIMFYFFLVGFFSKIALKVMF